MQGDPMRTSQSERPFSQVVLPEWVDFNGHLNVAFYALIFDRGTDAFLDELELGAAYCSETGHSTFALECHTRFLDEVREGARVVILSRLLGADHKRIHYLHEMSVVGSDNPCATLEQISIHVSLASRHSAPWPQSVFARLLTRAARDQALPSLPLCGAIGLRPRASS